MNVCNHIIIQIYLDIGEHYTALISDKYEATDLKLDRSLYFV